MNPNTLYAVTSDDDGLAEMLLLALENPAAQIDGPYISGTVREVTLDGHFDLVVVCRILREEIRKDIAQLEKLMTK